MGQQQKPDGNGNRQRNGNAPRRFRNDADRPRSCRRLGHDAQDTRTHYRGMPLCDQPDCDEERIDGDEWRRPVTL